MMAGIGIMLTKVAFDMSRKNKVIGYSSMAIGFLTFMITGDLVYTITISVLLTSILSNVMGQKSDIILTEREKIKFMKPSFSFNILRGALAMITLNIGSNITFGKITGEIANTPVNVDHLSIVSSLADLSSSLFGGVPFSQSFQRPEEHRTPYGQACS